MSNIIDQPQTVEELVKKALRKAIIAGEFLPGQEIDEGAFARKLQVSRMPIRNAISALEVEGLVKRIARRGAFVMELTEDEVEEAYSLRSVIEGKAIVIASQRSQESDISRIKEIVDLPKSYYKSPKSFLEKNREFHFQLLKPSKWERSIRYSTQLRNCFFVYLSLSNGYLITDIERSLVEHQQIFEAYLKKDFPTLCELNRAHIETAKKRVIGILNKKIKEKKYV